MLYTSMMSPFRTIALLPTILVGTPGIAIFVISKSVHRLSIQPNDLDCRDDQQSKDENVNHSELVQCVHLLFQGNKSPPAPTGLPVCSGLPVPNRAEVGRLKENSRGRIETESLFRGWTLVFHLTFLADSIVAPHHGSSNFRPNRLHHFRFASVLFFASTVIQRSFLSHAMPTAYKGIWITPS
jgi:hypothetical protein